MADDKTKVFVNTPMDEDLLATLDELVDPDEPNRAATIRKLIREEAKRRDQEQQAESPKTAVKIKR